MSPFAPPPPPAAIVFEESVSTETRKVSADGLISGGPVLSCGSSAVASPTLDGTQIQIADDTSATVPLNRTVKVIPMRAAHTSVRKKARQEKMSDFERDYPW